MKFGVNLINFGPGTNPESLTRSVNLVEATGYHLIMSSDHIAVTPDVSSRYPAPFYKPLTTMGWLTATTQSMEIGATVAILPYRSPLEIARAGLPYRISDRRLRSTSRARYRRTCVTEDVPKCITSRPCCHRNSTDIRACAK